MNTESHEKENIREFHSLEEVCEHFDLGELVSTKLMEGGSVNQTTCLITTKGKFILRRYKKNLLERIMLEAKFLDYLKNKKFKCGSVYSPEVFVYQGNYSLIFDFIEGQHPDVNDKNLIILGKQTALLHKLSEVYPEVPKQAKEKPYEDDFIRESLRATGLFESDKIDTLMEEIRSLPKRRGEVSKGLPKFLIHTDLYRENILAAGEDFYFIDFESLKVASPLSEIARIIQSWCLDDKRKVQIEKVKTFLTEYEKYRPLQKDEKDLLAFYYQSMLFYKVVYRAVYFFQEQDVTKKEEWRLSVKKTIETIEAFQSQKSDLERI